jgi:hypothetical protein
MLVYIIQCTQDDLLGRDGETMNARQEQSDGDESSSKRKHVCSLVCLVWIGEETDCTPR